MLTYRPVALQGRDAAILAVAAHPDDIEIGAGGTILRMLAAHPGRIAVTWVVCSATPQRAAEARSSAAAFSADARSLDLHLLDLPDSRFPARWAALKEALTAVAGRVDPDLILGPRPGDAHQDHDAVGRVLPTCFRDHAIWSYEIPKWDGDTIQPHLYVPLDDVHIDRKIALLHEHFGSQAGRDWWDEALFRALPRLRGVECRAPWAEAFVTPKTVVEL